MYYFFKNKPICHLYGTIVEHIKEKLQLLLYQYFYGKYTIGEQENSNKIMDCLLYNL